MAGWEIIDLLLVRRIWGEITDRDTAAWVLVLSAISLSLSTNGIAVFEITMIKSSFLETFIH